MKCCFRNCIFPLPYRYLKSRRNHPNYYLKLDSNQLFLLFRKTFKIFYLLTLMNKFLSNYFKANYLETMQYLSVILDKSVIKLEEFPRFTNFFCYKYLKYYSHIDELNTLKCHLTIL